MAARTRREGRSFGLTEEQALTWFEAELPKGNAHLFATVFRTCIARAYPFQASLGVCATARERLAEDEPWRNLAGEEWCTNGRWLQPAPRSP